MEGHTRKSPVKFHSIWRNIFRDVLQVIVDGLTDLRQTNTNENSSLECAQVRLKKDYTDFRAICPNYQKISSVGFYTSPQ